jgi:ATP-binding cassette subfamily B (MDR/TAP) protein 1
MPIQLCCSTAATRMTKALRIHFLEQTLRQDIAFFDSPANGSIALQLSSNGTTVNQGVSEKLGLLVQGCSTFVSAFIVALAVQWKLTLITITIVPAILIVTTVCIGIDIKSEARINPIIGKAAKLAEESFASIGTVHAYWAHPKLSASYGEYLEQAHKEGMKKSPNFGILFSVEFFCIYSGYALAFWQGVRMYASGEIAQPGSIVTYGASDDLWLLLR